VHICDLWKALLLWQEEPGVLPPVFFKGRQTSDRALGPSLPRTQSFPRKFLCLLQMCVTQQPPKDEERQERVRVLQLHPTKEVKGMGALTHHSGVCTLYQKGLREPST
jgi:hypothetical protein